MMPSPSSLTASLAVACPPVRRRRTRSLRRTSATMSSSRRRGSRRRARRSPARSPSSPGRIWPARRGRWSSTSSEDIPGASVVRSGGPGAAAADHAPRGQLGAHARPPRRRRDQRPDEPLPLGDLAHVPLDQVERIEILRGPQSTLYGSDALGGVVNIITATGAGRPKVVLYGTGGALVDGGRSAGDLRLDGTGGLLSRGLRPPDGRGLGGRRVLPRERRKRTATGTSPCPAGPASSSGAAWTSTSRSGPSGRGRRSIISAAPTATIRTTSRDMNRRSPGPASGGSSWEADGNPASVRRSSDRTGATTIPSTGRIPSIRRRATSGAASSSWTGRTTSSSGLPIRLTFGAEYESERGSSEYASESLYGPYLSPFPRADGFDLGVYAQDQLRLGGGFFATAGIRIDDHSLSGTAVTYQAGPGLGRRPDGIEGQGARSGRASRPRPSTSSTPRRPPGGRSGTGASSPRKARDGTPASSRTSPGAA